MSKFDVEIRGLRETQQKMEQVIRDVHGRPMERAMKRATLVVQRDAKKNAPVDTGRLRASITPEVRAHGAEVVGVVGSNVIYAPFMELGTGVYGKGGRHWPPASALETWARRHGFPSGFVVAFAIGRRGGLKAKRFLQKAVEDNRQRIVDILDKGVKGIVDE